MPDGGDEAEPPAVQPVDERSGEQPERDERDRLRQADGAGPRDAAYHLPDLEHHLDDRHLAAKTGQGLADPIRSSA
ncbi:hypothetical protein AB0K16_42005 [Nonomuraea jabiensis]|uniref:hypothetical protein n=1 Tax=Nonomuraea jabiensis TaxID=882448 RepID=UPI0034338F3C